VGGSELFLTLKILNDLIKVFVNILKFTLESGQKIEAEKAAEVVGSMALCPLLRFGVDSFEEAVTKYLDQ
jgi:hypothetical protein